MTILNVNPTGSAERASPEQDLQYRNGDRHATAPGFYYYRGWWVRTREILNAVMQEHPEELEKGFTFEDVKKNIEIIDSMFKLHRDLMKKTEGKYQVSSQVIDFLSALRHWSREKGVDLRYYLDLSATKHDRERKQLRGGEAPSAAPDEEPFGVVLPRIRERGATLSQNLWGGGIQVEVEAQGSGGRVNSGNPSSPLTNSEIQQRAMEITMRQNQAQRPASAPRPRATRSS